MLIRYRFYYSSCFFLMCSCCDWFVYMNSLCCIMLKTNEKKENEGCFCFLFYNRLLIITPDSCMHIFRFKSYVGSFIFPQKE